jgi:hypothetical protein
MVTDLSIPGLNIHDVCDYRFGVYGLPPMPMQRVIYQCGARHLAVIKHTDTCTYTVQEVAPNPHNQEWSAIGPLNFDLDEYQAQQIFIEWIKGQ